MSYNCRLPLLQCLVTSQWPNYWVIDSYDNLDLVQQVQTTLHMAFNTQSNANKPLALYKGVA